MVFSRCLLHYMSGIGDKKLLYLNLNSVGEVGTSRTDVWLQMLDDAVETRMMLNELESTRGWRLVLAMQYGVPCLIRPPNMIRNQAISCLG